MKISRTGMIWSLAAVLLASPAGSVGMDIIKISDNPLIGTWKFVSLKAVNGRGEVKYFYGERVFGRLFYTSGGHMSALLMNPDRPKFKSNDLLKGTEEEVRAAFYGFDAYCGTYTVDPVRKIVTHHVLGSRYPNWVGSDQVRSYDIHGGRLRLTATLTARGEEWAFEAVLFRL
jgi:hypothetical protein